MGERLTSEYLISVPQRGLRVIPPAETREKMEMARRGERVGKWSEEEKIRLQLITKSTILRKRYPTVEDGRKFMTEVDYNRQKELVIYAEELTYCIVNQWQKINPNKDIACVLFGSVTRGLVKNPNHPDPSNLDLAVIGDFTEDERLQLLDAIRPTRSELQQTILSSCPNVPEELVQSSGNAGVFVQQTEKVTKNDYATAMEYIRANAVALHDPANLWKEIEHNALQTTLNKVKVPV